MYCFYQTKGGAHAWECALASERDRLISQDKVEFVSVLDVDNSFTQDLTREELDAVKYAAPNGFYADFDGDLEEVLGQAKVFLLKLQDEQKFDLSQARLWFTGGRGCHIELPIPCFLPKVPPSGIAHLPAIFKEIAMMLYVDTLDLRVYTGKRGRQWRTPNVQRSNGLYKVQVTVDEFLDATPETYESICKAPRAPLPLSPASFNPKLGLLFNQAKEKTELSLRRRKSKKASAEQAERFNGQWPDSFRLLLTGENLKPTVGWNQIAMQVASFGIALGKTEEQVIEDAQGLINYHAGDSDRYGSPKKRERELRNQYRYQDGNPCYEFSLGGIKSLFAKGSYTSDIDWTGTVEDDPEPSVEGDEAEGEDGDSDEAPTEDEDKDARIMFGKNGIFALTEEGPKKVCPIGITMPCSLVNKEHKHIGFEFQAYLGGRELGQAFITLGHLKTKASFNEWVNQFATWQNITDLLVTHLLDALRVRTERSKKKMIVTSREGVDLIIPPGAKSIEEFDLIFASPSECLSPKDRPYRFRGQHDEHGAFKSDLLDAPRLEDTEEHREFFDKLWHINTQENLAKVAGWFSAAFLCQLIRHRWRAFPMLQVWGEAGAGKSQTVELWSHLHYYLRNPKKISSAGNTFFPMMAAVTQSASIPVIFEELKPRQMAKYQLDQVQNLMRTNYTGDALERGSVNKDVAGGGTKVNGYDNVAPIMFIGEAVESQTAIAERCVSVPLSKADRSGRSEFFEYVYARRQGRSMASLGRSMVDMTLALDPDAMNLKVEDYRKMFREKIGTVAYENQNRPWHNLAVVLTGLDLLKLTLERTFGDRYNETIEGLKESLIGNALVNTHRTMSEAAKVLDVMAQLTRVSDVQYQLVKGTDYVTDGNTVDLKLRPAYAKYVRYQLSLRQEVLFDNDRAFIEGVKRYEGKIADSCPDSTLYRNPYEPLFRFDCAVLANDGCELFEM